MHPASSIIFFTTSAGAGYGLLFLIGLAAPVGLIPDGRWLGFVTLGLALGLAVAGLVSSTFHLGHPERAWRAMSQWRSSWLSREGVAALVTFAPAGLFAIGWVFLEATGGVWGLFGLLAAAGAVVTVGCTAMIYASLKTIRQWHNPFVLPLYLAFALMSGALWLNVLLHFFGAQGLWSDLLALVSPILAWGLKMAYWRDVDGATGASTPETATGLGAIGQVRLLEPPHTDQNYLMREMGFTIARKHAEKLRRIALFLGLGCCVVLAAVALFTSGVISGIAVFLAAVAGSLSILLERWLFFAEATHTVMLYYGARSA
ncbi:MAG: DmsC/YnfH family molybdoenzyme membrane anchor subunit [Pseudomonadota bacterium]